MCSGDYDRTKLACDGHMSAAEVDLEFENDLGVDLSGIPNS